MAIISTTVVIGRKWYTVRRSADRVSVLVDNEVRYWTACASEDDAIQLAEISLQALCLVRDSQ